MNLTESQKMYDNLTVGYRDYSRLRSLYLNSVDSIVKHYIQPNCSVVDFGAGDGVRINNIVNRVTDKLCLVENSHNMVLKIKEKWPRAVILNQDFSAATLKLKDTYDVATCLWNVLGHLGTRQQVLTGLINIRKAIKQDGIVVLDVNNRHNIAQYGWHAVRNIIKDNCLYKFQNGDIKFNITLDSQKIPASVHIFNKHEIEKLFVEAGFNVKHKYYINYATGNIEKTSLFGQLCYVLVAQR